MKNQKMRFHLLGLAHLATNRTNSACAYTQKVLKLAKIIKNYDHTLYFYGVEGSDVICDESITVSSQDILVRCYGDYDKSKEFFKHNPFDLAHRTFNQNAIKAINERKQTQDVLLCPMGNYQKPIADAVELLTVESGIGYTGVFSNYRIFESYAWMHYIYGLLNQSDGSWYDAVIPNYFDINDFPFKAEKEDFLLYFGRIIHRKGVQVASDVAKATGNQLYIVGQGSLDDPAEGLQLGSEKHIKYFPAVGPEERAWFLGNAKAVLMPTYYLEPFGGVNVEAQLCGTPVITSDWGAFPETVLHGVTGYRCRTFEEFCWAVKNIHRIKPEDCRKWAETNYSIERIGRMYEEYFQRINNLFQKGWYQPNEDRQDLEWLNRYYP
ncbi:MAG TPA: glycosyltransferase [Bacillota bacterium]|nr:glycosyltransferase [Bacillota bacterium]HOL09173.1 glycosyltransferase [Bacillota bacterium]HPO96848.1 glycosyltransferase [Bacillota bacterium]